MPAAPGVGYVRGGLARSLRPFLARYPRLDVRGLLDAAGISLQHIGDPAAWISVRRSAGMFEAAAIATNDAAFTLEFAKQLPLRDLGVFAEIMVHSATVGSALANGARYFGLHSTGASVQLAVEGRDAEMNYGFHDAAIVQHGQNTEMLFALLVRLVREAAGDPAWAPSELRFEHSRPRRDAAQRAFFRCPLVFDQPYDAMVLTPDDLRTPLPRADAQRRRDLVASVTPRLPSEAAVEPHRFHRQVRRVVAASLRGGDVTIEQVARQLDTSVRTIQRRLQERGQSFKELVGETRLARSQHYLANAAMSLTDTAALLGYSELSAFSRAFRRWTGETALDVRRRLIAPPA